MRFDPGPPQRDEAAEYYFKYISLVPDGSVVDTLSAQRDETLAVLRAIPEERAGHRYADGKWSVREVVGHINDTERLFAMRAFWFARGFDSPLPSFEQEIAAANGANGELPLAAYVDEFDALRASTVHLFDHLTPEAWMRRGIASGMPFSVRALAYIGAGHVMHHMNVLRERYL
jgi:hypothetical protein